MPNLFSSFNLGRRGITGTSGSIERDFALIKANLNREISNIKDRTNKGLLIAGADIRRDMEDTPPLIPIDYGNLRASFFMVTKKTARSTTKSMEVRHAKFKKAETTAKLAALQVGHQEVLAQAEEAMAAHDIGVMLGFSAFYAAPVHEMIGPINWKRSGSGAKFFQAAVYRNWDKTLATVKLNAQVRP